MEDSLPLLSYDILFSVFMGLSIKSLLRFKSVSTYWRAIISEDTFVKAQRDQSKALGRRKLLLKNRTSGEFKLIDIENPKFIRETQEKFLLKNYVVLCSLDGLLLLKEENYMNFVLWNPSTRQHRNLESYLYVNDYILPHACGLCYDDFISTDDYKVILIYRLFYVVYSTSTRSWMIKTNPIRLPNIELLRSCYWNRGISQCISRGISIEGCVYWSLLWKLDEINVGKSCTIIYFDVKSDELKEIPLPPPDLYNDHWLLPCALKGCLGLYNVKKFNMKSNIWIMEQDGWRLVTKPFCDVRGILSMEEYHLVMRTHPLCWTGNGEIIFCRLMDGIHHDLSIYNIEEQRFVTKSYKLNYHEFMLFSQDVTCLDSLCFPRLN